MTRPPYYIASNSDGTFTAYVEGKGFRANSTLARCLAFIREQTGLTHGAVPVRCLATGEWVSEFDLAEGVERPC